MASFIASIFTNKVFLERKEEKDFLETWGTQNIYETRQAMNIVCNEYIEENIQEIDMIGFGLSLTNESALGIIAEF